MKKRIVITAVVALVIAVSFFLYPRPTSTAPGSVGSAAISLLPPSFVKIAAAQGNQRAGTDVISAEAGISAYTKAQRSITLSSIKRIYRTIELETDQYIIGSVAIPNYDEAWDVHLYAHVDGWLLAYYLNDEPAIKIYDWANFEATEKGAMVTHLETVLGQALGIVGGGRSDISFYDFRYPEANGLIFFADVVRFDAVPDLLQFQIPGDFTLFETAWLVGSNNSGYFVSCNFNDSQLAKIEGNHAGYIYDMLPPIALDNVHRIKLEASRYSIGTCGISIVYQAGE